MIVVDTSVWVAARRQPRIATVLERLMDADEIALARPVRLELLAGIARHQRKGFLRRFGAFPQLVATEDTWSPLPEWISRAADAGHRFSISDLLIAALAAEIGGLVWSLDSDFARMEELQFVSLYSPD